jgi:hypothetical protein
VERTQGKKWHYGLVVALFLTVGWATETEPALGKTKAIGEGGQPARIAVQVYNYAQVSSEMLTQAELEAAEIYRAVGLEIVWNNCKLPEDSQCAEYLDPTHLGVRLLPDIAAALSDSNLTMGLAVGNLASVSLRRVREEAAAFEVSVHAVLAPTLAHEIGHLLLAAQGHSPSGIMRAHWRREDYERAPRGAFSFTSKQAQSIRAEVRRRVQEPAAGELVRRTASK